MDNLNKDPALEALQILVSSIRKSATTGQRRRITGFLASLYDGESFPFDLTNLRALDQNLREACLKVLIRDSLGLSEIHTWGVFDADELNRWLVEDRHYYCAQVRRISRDLYNDRFGDQGHPD